MMRQLTCWGAFHVPVAVLPQVLLVICTCAAPAVPIALVGTWRHRRFLPVGEVSEVSCGARMEPRNSKSEASSQSLGLPALNLTVKFGS